MKTETQYAAEILALAEFLNCDPADITETSWDHYGMKVFTANGDEYAVGNDDSAAKAVESNIEDSIWAFNASFIVSMCDLPDQLVGAIQAWQEKDCESANDGLLELVNRMCGMKGFVENAVSSDGRGHFLSSYDGEENSIKVENEEISETYFIYRTN